MTDERMKERWRPFRERPIALQRITETICVCHMTDGFCSPARSPKCQCHTLARAVFQTLKTQLHKHQEDAGWDIVHEAWLRKDKADPAKIWDALLSARWKSVEQADAAKTEEPTP